VDGGTLRTAALLPASYSYQLQLLFELPIPRQLKLAKTKQFSIFQLLWSSLEICYKVVALTLVVNRSGQEFGLEPIPAAHLDLQKNICLQSFFGIKRLLCLGPGKLGPQQLNHHFFQVPLEQLAAKDEVLPSLHPGLSMLV